MQPRFDHYRHHIDKLVEAALQAVEPQTAVSQHLSRQGNQLTVGKGETAVTHDLETGRVFIVSIGKAAVPMVKAALNVLADVVSGCVVVPKKGERDWSAELDEWLLGDRIQLLPGAHPVSDADSVTAATAVLSLVKQASKQDLVLFLISGGASALLAQPLISLTDWQRLTDVLLASGCTIQELNTVRRQLDAVKGGGLAQAAAPASCISLILSDVIGNQLDAIGSGPTVAVNDTAVDALTILQRYGVATTLGETAVWRRILLALHRANTEQETKRWPTENHHFIIGSVKTAAMATMIRGVQLGFVSEVVTTHLEGEAREVGRVMAAIAKDMQPGYCRIFGGETTVTLRGEGKGGRNLEAALSMAIALQGHGGVVVASVATDGEDGPTTAAGAVVSGETAVLAQEHRLNPHDFLAKNDSYTFFSHLDSAVDSRRQQTLVETGSTGTNVNDLIIILTYPQNGN
ncbi:MAG: DUF4147 domain-containing protein [Chloroflexota bacterium]